MLAKLTSKPASHVGYTPIQLPHLPVVPGATVSAHLASVSEECQTDSGVSAPGPGAGRRRAEGNLWELVLSTTQAGG